MTEHPLFKGIIGVMPVHQQSQKHRQCLCVMQ